MNLRPPTALVRLTLMLTNLFIALEQTAFFSKEEKTNGALLGHKMEDTDVSKYLLDFLRY